MVDTELYSTGEQDERTDRRARKSDKRRRSRSKGSQRDNDAPAGRTDEEFVDACFFFSSRRRHTRWPRDWSSDVCSSDLGVLLHATVFGGLDVAIGEVIEVGYAQHGPGRFQLGHVDVYAPSAAPPVQERAEDRKNSMLGGHKIGRASCREGGGAEGGGRGV